MISLVKSVGEFSAVALSSLIVGSGIGFVQALCVALGDRPYRQVMLALEEALSDSDALALFGYIGGVVAVFVGLLDYYVLFRRHVTLEIACRIVILSLVVGMIGGYALQVWSVFVTPLATIAVSVCFPDDGTAG
mgnify:CR=1 FL=1